MTEKQKTEVETILESYMHWINDGLLPVLKARRNKEKFVDLNIGLLSGIGCPLCKKYRCSRFLPEKPKCPIYTETGKEACEGTVFYGLREISMVYCSYAHQYPTDKKAINLMLEMCLFLKRLYHKKVAEYESK